jgi:hypothetical protein
MERDITISRGLSRAARTASVATIQRADNDLLNVLV